MEFQRKQFREFTSSKTTYRESRLKLQLRKGEKDGHLIDINQRKKIKQVVKLIIRPETPVKSKSNIEIK